ncbi:MAG TPA: Vms1/Ankzf1 family peptidyl-tRNA hydrolase [Solirubrobacteraceae bacterium]|jgi:peptide subunit release factor 1 (eRF1)
MAVPSLTRNRLRQLAELRPEQGRVLSVFLNLDPAEFATGAAKSTAITSLMNDAADKVEAEAGSIGHDDHQALREDLERVREVLDASDLAAGGVKGVAVYACKPADVLEVVRLSHPIESRALVDDSPYVEPLVTAGEAERWGVMLANRRTARIFVGTAESLEEYTRLDSDTKGQHSDGGWSQQRYERSIEEEKRSHLASAADILFAVLRRRPFDHLLLGSPPEHTSEIEGDLHPYLKQRLAGQLSIDVENSTAEDVRNAAAPLIDEHLRAREREVLDRFAQEAGRGGRAATGLQATLQALNEQRVEVLLIGEGFRAGGLVETQTRMLTVDGGEVPVDNPQFERRDDILESAIEKTMEQSADVMVIRRFPDLGAHGGIGALLRF